MISQTQRWQNWSLKLLIISLFLIGTAFVLLPFVKRSLISYRIATATTTVSQGVPTNSSTTTGSAVIQPPTLKEALALYSYVPEGAIGRLVIPDVAIDLSVFPTLVNQNLLLGAVSMFPERQPATDNLVLISHHLWNERLLFGPLMEVTIGQDLFLSYGDQSYHYLVEEVKTVDATAIGVMASSGRGELTLITCDSPTLTTQRLVVRGRPVAETTKAEMSKVLRQGPVTSSETATYLVVMREFSLIIVAVMAIILIIVWIMIKL